MSELKPCPFCGGKAKVNSKAMDGLVHMWVSCTECDATSAIIVYRADRVPVRLSQKISTFTEPLYKKWNRRIDDE